MNGNRRERYGDHSEEISSVKHDLRIKIEKKKKSYKTQQIKYLKQAIKGVS